jgi:hypothetical protein
MGRSVTRGTPFFPVLNVPGFKQLRISSHPVLLNPSFYRKTFLLIVSWSALPERKTRITQGLATHPEGDHEPMKSIKTALLTCTFFFAVGAFAWQYPAGSQSTQPSQPQGTMQPSQPSQTQPSQGQPSQNQGAMQPGQQQPGTAQSQGAPQAGHPSIDDQVRTLSDQLNLSADQQAKVKSALEDQHTQAMTVVQDSSLAREDKIEKIHALREATISKVRTSLNDDQKKKFDQMVQQQAPPPQQAPPQPK